MASNGFGNVLGVAAAFVILYLLFDNDDKKKQIKALKKNIEDNNLLSTQIKQQLTDLITNNKDIEPKIAVELGQITALLEIKQDSTAIFKLAKIIENLLKELYKGEATVKEIATKNNRKAPVFADYIEHSKNQKIISTEDYHLLLILKSIRNDEAHQLAITKEKSRLVASIVSGLNIILQLSSILKKQSLSV